MHALCDYHRTCGVPLPNCLKILATNIRYEWVGIFPSRDALVVQGLASSTSLEHGVVKSSWLDIVLEIVGHGPESGYGESLKTKVMAICPEHAMAMADWQHMQALTCRVARSTYAIIERFMMKHRLATPPIPQSWLRDQYILLKGRKGGDFCSEREQNLALIRMLGTIEEIVRKSGIDLATSLVFITRRTELNEASRKNVVRLAKKYNAGMESSHAHYGRSYDFDERFARGEFDAIVHATSNPSLAGRYWAWVKEAEQQRLEAERAEERKALECAAASAAKDAEQIVSEARGMQSSLEADVKRRDDEIIAKYMDTYTLHLRTFHHKVSGITKDRIAAIEEAWVLHHDTEDQLRESFMQQCQGRFVVVPAVKNKSSVVLQGPRAWNTAIDASTPLLMWIDLGFTVLEAADLRQAITLVGKCGLVVLLQPFSALSDVVAQEAALFTEVDYEKTSVVRVFMQWKTSLGLKISYAFLLFDASMESAHSLLLQRVLNSTVVTQTGALFNLPACENKAMDSAGRHVLHEGQRGQAFYLRFLTDVGLATPMMLHGTVPIDFVICEADGGVGDLLHIIIEQNKKSNIFSKSTQWVGTTTFSSKCRSTASRSSRLVQLVEEDTRYWMDRQGSSAEPSAASFHARAKESADLIPQVPRLPDVLRERAQFEVTLPRHVRLPACDAARAIPLLEAQPQHFLHYVPAPFALQVKCMEVGLVVGPSILFRNTNGLYATRDFDAGEIICTGANAEGRWLRDDEVKVQANHLRVELQLISPFRRPHVMVLDGDPTRDPWACLNPSPSKEHPVNVVSEIVFGEMGSSFLVFKAARTIKAFSTELLWQDDASSPPVTTQKDSQPPESGDEHTLDEDSLSQAPSSEPASPPTDPKVELEPSPAQGTANVPQPDAAAVDDPRVPEPEAAAVDVPALQQLRDDGQVIGSITEPDGKLLFAPPDRVYATFDDKKCVSKLSPRILLSSLHGKVVATSSWKHVEYALSDSSKIFFNHEIYKLSDARQNIRHIWGKGVVNKTAKIKAQNVNSDGEPVALWWEPQKSAMRAYIEVLLSNSNVKPMFMMEATKGPGGTTLTPCGVCFNLTKPVKIQAVNGALPAIAVIAPASSAT